MDYVASARKLRVCRKALNLIGQTVGAEINPTDHASNKVVFFCELKQPSSLFKILACLYCDAAVKPKRCEEWLQVLRQKIALQGVHLIGHPGVLVWIVAPEVLMRI